MDFKMNPRAEAEVQAELQQRMAAAVQEAEESTATAYTADADLDVAEHLRSELADRGINITDEDWLAEAATQIRSGHGG